MNAPAESSWAVVVVVSDRRAAGTADDTAGPRLAARVREILPHARVDRRVVPDERAAIVDTLAGLRDEGAQLVLTTGGTGFGPRDVTPEATRSVLDRPAPGLVVAMVTAGLETTPYAMLSRATAGIAGGTLVVNLPGSPGGALEGLDAIAAALPHALAVLRDHPSAAREHGGGTP